MKKVEIKKNEILEKALAHTIQKATYNDEIFDIAKHIEIEKGNTGFLIRLLQSFSDANSMVCWIRDGDLNRFKEWSYISAKLNRMVFQYDPNSWLPTYMFFGAVLSDQAEIIDWYKQFTLPYEVNAASIKDRDNPRQPDFHGYQLILALNGKWDELRIRCEQILSLEIKKDRKYLIDHRFYLALANGDQIGMENVLTELTSPKIARVRNYEFAFTFTEHFIATHATLYAKLAWLSGYKVQIDTPLIPKEWLPIQPLAEYPEPWAFMTEFDIWQPFDGDWAKWSPEKNE